MKSFDNFNATSDSISDNNIKIICRFNVYEKCFKFVIFLLNVKMSKNCCFSCSKWFGSQPRTFQNRPHKGPFRPNGRHSGRTEQMAGQVAGQLARAQGKVLAQVRWQVRSLPGPGQGPVAGQVEGQVQLRSQGSSGTEVRKPKSPRHICNLF